MLWLIANIFVYGFEIFFIALAMLCLIGWISPEMKETKLIGTIHRIMDFTDDEEEEAL